MKIATTLRRFDDRNSREFTDRLVSKCWQNRDKLVSGFLLLIGHQLVTTDKHQFHCFPSLGVPMVTPWQNVHHWIFSDEIWHLMNFVVVPSQNCNQLLAIKLSVANWSEFPQQQHSDEIALNSSFTLSSYRGKNWNDKGKMTSSGKSLPFQNWGISQVWEFLCMKKLCWKIS